MRKTIAGIALLLTTVAPAFGSDAAAFRGRCQRVGSAFRDGIDLIHAVPRMDIALDGYRQDPYFYYLTGQENAVGAILGIEGKSGESWLFLPSHPPFAKYGLKPPIAPGPGASQQTGIDHVVDWTELSTFLAARAPTSPTLYYAVDGLAAFEEVPPNLSGSNAGSAPAWLQLILASWPSFTAKDVTDALNNLMAVQDPEEIANLRSVAESTVVAIQSGMQAIRPGISQRAVESAVESACWSAGAHGSNFWPWVMSGENAAFPKPLASLADYDHLNRQMQSGELVRLDVGCEYKHYLGDLGRTVPVSGHYANDQRETWNIFVAAYRKAVTALREGVKVDDVYAAWSKELLAHRATAKTPLAQHARLLVKARKCPLLADSHVQPGRRISARSSAGGRDHQLRADCVGRRPRLLPRRHVPHAERRRRTPHSGRSLHRRRN